MRQRHIETDNDLGIDMTPMLDIVFIMLIFFIVTTSFIRESGIDVNRPKASTASEQKNASLLVAIRPNGEIWIDKRSVDVRAVRANIEKLRAENPQGSVVIQADRDARTGLLIKVMDQIRLAGVENVSIATEGVD
jgi:biopolymer transport protein ExbD